MASRTKQGTYYLGRVIKLGILDTAKIVEALKDPVKIEAGEHCWTITSFKEFKENNKLHFVYGTHLSGEILPNIIKLALNSRIMAHFPSETVIFNR
jgi:hypothetical protein